jgi:hypothetical protein
MDGPSMSFPGGTGAVGVPTGFPEGPSNIRYTENSFHYHVAN